MVHDERIMTRDDVLGRVSQAFDLAKGIKHGRDVYGGNERAVRLQILVIMARIGGEHDVAALRVDPHDLHPCRMAGRKVQRQPRRDLHVTVVQFEATLEVEPYHPDDILLLEAVAEVGVALPT